MAEGKTGALFAFCADSVALAAGFQEVRPAFSKMGFHLGLAFQLADDLKDFTDSDSGKPLYADIPLWESAENQNITQIAETIRETGAIEAVVSLLIQETAAALDAIARFDSQSLLGQRDLSQ